MAVDIVSSPFKKLSRFSGWDGVAVDDALAVEDMFNLAGPAKQIGDNLFARRWTAAGQILKGGDRLFVAITSTGSDLNSPMDERFGRARYILIVDTDTEEVQVIDNNDNLNAVQGAGIQSAQKMADHNVEWVITGHVGPKAFQALSKAKIKMGSGTQKTCRDALVHWKNGGYEPLTEADVNSHWG